MLAYELDVLEKDYSGPSTKLLTELMKFMVPRGEAVIFNATDQGRTVAAILVFLHGASATYQVGWTSDKGRKLAAHHQLLWRAMLSLKERGIKDLDLGGVNDESAAGIKRFKTGLGGEEVALVGFFN